jgi:hypothetical protein
MPGTYVVVAKCRASAILAVGAQIVVTCNLPDRPPFMVAIWTNYGGSFDISIPLELCAEVKGAAPSLKEAGELFANTARGINAVIAFAVNADTGVLEPELIFDASPDKDQHEYLQSFIANTPIQAIPNRRIDVGATQALIAAIGKHKEQERLRRVTSQYAQALNLWQPGHEIECLSHLYMGVEAATKLILREHVTRIRTTEEELAVTWGVPKKHLESEARRRLIFCEDTATYQTAKKISDGFEHGFGDYDTMRKPAQDVIVRCAGYLRGAIIRNLGLDRSVEEILLDAQYEEPRGPVLLVRYLRGTLIGKADQLAAPDQRYPIMDWRWQAKSVSVDAEGKFSIEPNSTVTPRLGEGVQFLPLSFEVWDGSKITTRASTVTSA